MSHRLWLTVCCCAVMCLVSVGLTRADSLPQPEHQSTVGRSAVIEQVVIPGSELVVKRQEDRTPIVLRIVATYPHGDEFRYDLEYYGLEAGTFDLATFLQRKDGSAADDLPEISVTINPLLPPGQVEPNTLQYEELRDLGGYRQLLTAGIVVWVIGLVALIVFSRRKSRLAEETATKQLSLADRLKPLVTDAIAGELPRPQLAELEMMLVAYWRRRLKLEDSQAADLIPQLREHDEAGPLLTQLEAWLHQPDRGGDVDVTALLAPYRELPEDALENVPQSSTSNA